MDDEAYMIALLEEIAFNTSAKALEKPQYLEGVYHASRKQKTAPILHDSRARAGEAAGRDAAHVEGRNAQVRLDQRKGPATAQVKKPSS